MKIQEAEYTEVLKLRHESMYPDASIDLAKVENDNQGIHLGAFEGGEMVACVSIFLEGRNLQFRKLATKPKHRNKGYATELIKYLIDYHRQFQFDRLWANARQEAVSIYEKLDFKQTKETFTKNGHDYVIVEYCGAMEV